MGYNDNYVYAYDVERKLKTARDAVGDDLRHLTNGLWHALDLFRDKLQKLDKQPQENVDA
jgi:hypothetical protein